MSLYDDASLIMYPSGYKEDKIYSLKPTDGSGDLTFTRASTATRVNAAGLVEDVPYNLLKYSQSFTTNWSYTAGSFVTAGQIGYDGTTKAVLFTDSGAIAAYGAYQIFSTLETVTLSIYAKSASTNIFVIDFLELPTPTTSIKVNLSTGVIISGIGTVQSIGNGWYRISVTATIINNGYVRFGCEGAGTVYIQNIQANIGSTAKPYFPTTDRLDVPRIDYTGGGCGKLLLEKQSTNLVTYSEQFDNAAWIKNNSTVTSNQGISPDGYTNADLFYINSAGDVSSRRIIQFISVSNATTYTASVFVKSSSARWMWFPAPDASSVNHNAWFDLENGVVGTLGSSVIDASIVSYGNGWYRCSITSLSTSTTNYVLFSPVTADGSTTTLTGSSNGFLTYGASLEAGSYATSYIPTLASSVTRLADSVSKTGISSLIGQTQGTLFVDSILTHSAASNQYLIQVSASSSNRFFIYREGTTNKIGCFALIGSTQIYTQLTAAAITGRFKAAFTYQSGNFAFYVNGIQIGTSAATFTAPPSMGRLDIDQNIGLENGYYNYNQAIVFPTRLTNTQLQSLTSL